jgi:hypothetical protein
MSIFTRINGNISGVELPGQPSISAPISSNPVPEADRTNYQNLLSDVINELPNLVTPLMAAGISLEVLIEAIQAEERKTGVLAASESLKAKSEARKETNDKALAEIKERLETMAKQKSLSPFLKAFKILGMVLGGIAAIATTVVGAITGNPLLVAAGVLMAALVVDSVVSAASDGKYSISAGVTALAEKCGASPEAAKWIALGVQLALIVATVVLSFGAAGGSSAASGASSIAKSALHVLVKAQQAASVANGLVAIGSGACQIAAASFDYQTTNSHARTKEFEAILARLKESTESEEDFLKFLLENIQILLAKVSEIVKESNAAQLRILSGGPPALA